VFLIALTALITVTSFSVQPHLAESFRDRPWAYGFPALALAGLAGMRFVKGRNGFLLSCVYLLGMLTSAAAGLYPYVLPANTDPALGLTIENAAAPTYGLRIGLAWFIPGMLLAAGYFVYTYRHSFGSGSE
jgi:cytochrome d ubiquinol oxidase subunit II